ncbi:MAG: hypothetical protein AB7O67_17035 [Vicinamibacterales bacterium]
MNILTRDTVAELAEVRTDSCVSLFMPAHPAGPDVRPVVAEDLIRWKSLLRTAEMRLKDLGTPDHASAELLAPARALLEDQAFWQYQGDGLAAFIAPDFFRTFRVPLPLAELVVVGAALHLKPLLPLLAGDGRFYVLALSQNAARLVECTRHTAREIDRGDAPESLAEALRFDRPEPQIQHHTLATSGAAPGGVIHGQGGGEDDRDTRLLRFCQQVDRGLLPLLHEDTTPLVLAAVESVAAVYRQANTYRHLLSDIVSGNAEGLSARELRDRAWPLVEPRLSAGRQAALERYGTASAAGAATSDVEAALAAATDGRVDVLFVPVGVQRWGTFDDETRQAVIHDEPQQGDEDLLNVAAVRALLTGSTVYALPPGEIPGGGAVAALLRY